MAFNRFFIIVFLLSSFSIFAKDHDVTLVSSPFKLHQKGDVYITWGYNRSWYADSDIHFTGQGHDFIAYDVEATDRYSPLSLTYINPVQWSTPQFNFRVGYFLSSKYSISIGWDHMKYVATNYQTFNMYGAVNPALAPDPVMQANMERMNQQYTPNGNGLYNNVEVTMDPTMFLSYEHTDGFNYATVDLERYDKLWQHKKYDKLGLTWMSGVGLGTIVPRTDAHLFGSGKNHYWNLAGWGTNLKAALQFNFSKHFFFESNFKVGYVQMLKVHTSNHYGIDKAKQDIVFYENNWVLGFKF